MASGALAWGQSCGPEPPAVKPVTPVGCQNTAHACICLGSSCNWQWVCVTNQPAGGVSNGNTSDPLAVFQNAKPTQPFDVGAYMQQKAAQQAQIEALQAQAALARAQLQPYLEEQARQRQAVYDSYVEKIRTFAVAGDYQGALGATNDGLKVFPGNPSLKLVRKKLKAKIKAQKKG